MTRNRWLIIIASVTALLVLVGGYVMLPYRTVSKINDSLEQGQSLWVATGISSRDLQAQLATKERERMEADISQGNADSPYLLLGPAMAELMAERAAWEKVNLKNLSQALLTPEGLSVFREAPTSFNGLSVFTVTPENPNAPVLVLERKGFRWEVERLEFRN